MGSNRNVLLKNSKGITLIALVITIVVLLILASVSIAMLTGDNGILKKANEAKEKTIISGEKEAIDLSIMSYKIDKDPKYMIGIQLYDKTMENSAIWDIIITKNPESIYGTNWRYIEKGTEIENYGKAQNEWVVNYETGEVIRLKEYTRLTHNMNLGVTDGLIFNIDPSIIEGVDIEELKNGNTSILGNNVELMNFDWNENSGLTSTQFNFDGNDDYIKVKYDSKEEKDLLAQRGYTFEYYGRISEGISFDNKTQEIISSPYKGIFCYWNGDENRQAVFRMGVQRYKENNNIKWNSSNDLRGVYSDYSEDKAEWNIMYPIKDFKYGDEIYYTITLDTTKEFEKDGEKYYKAILYINGEKLYDGNYNKKQWDNFIQKHLDNLKYFCMGRSSMSDHGQWHYSKLNAYTCRLYNKALTTEEVKDNYDKSVSYHENAIKSKNK